jgi:hypothetical protein
MRNGNRQTISVTTEASKDGNFFFQSDDDSGLFKKLAAPATLAAPAPLVAPTAPMRTLFRGPII